MRQVRKYQRVTNVTMLCNICSLYQNIQEPDETLIYPISYNRNPVNDVDKNK